MYQAICYTDGSCGKDRSGGWACILTLDNGTSVEMAGWEPDTTNNRMEMVAAIRGLEFLVEPHRVFLASDSAYMLNTLKHRWYIEWFRSNKGRKNLDLWRLLVDHVNYHTTEFIKIQGHATDEMNIRADKMAVEARKERLGYKNVNRSTT